MTVFPIFSWQAEGAGPRPPQVGVGDDIVRTIPGARRVVEVYPAVALRQWGVAMRGYETITSHRPRALDSPTAPAPWLHVSDEHERLIDQSDDAFDAVKFALCARAHYLGQTYGRCKRHFRLRESKAGSRFRRRQ